MGSELHKPLPLIRAWF